jgi:hypothetical protein
MRTLVLGRGLTASVVLLVLAAPEKWCSLSAQSSTELKNRFLDEAPRQWENYRKHAKRLQGKIDWSKTVQQPGSRLRWETSYEIKQRDGFCLFTEQRRVTPSRDDRIGWLRVTNPRYGFELHQRATNKPWAVAQVHVGGSGALPFEPPQDMADHFATMACSMATISIHLPAVIIRAPGYSLEKVSPVVQHGKTLARAQFTYRPEKPVPTALRGGWVLYDPERFWVIREYEARMEYARPGNAVAKGTLAGRYEYRDSAEGLPILRRTVSRGRVPGEATDTESINVFDLREADVPEADFTLSAFGFPEPPGLGKRAPRWSLWAAGAGVLFLALGVLLRLMSRRARAASRSA